MCGSLSSFLHVLSCVAFVCMDIVPGPYIANGTIDTRIHALSPLAK